MEYEKTLLLAKIGGHNGGGSIHLQHLNNNYMPLGQTPTLVTTVGDHPSPLPCFTPHSSHPRIYFERCSKQKIQTKSEVKKKQSSAANCKAEKRSDCRKNKNNNNNDNNDNDNRYTNLKRSETHSADSWSRSH